MEPGLAHIRHFAVNPVATGCAFGAALYDRCRTAAQAVWVTRLEVYASLNAVGFYARMGFTRIEDVSIQLAPEVASAAVRMRANL